jgi:SAM-dependent methyltransferase
MKNKDDNATYITPSRGQTVLDVCCGSRAMWFDRKDPRAIYLDRRRETVTEILPTRNQKVVIDPDIVSEFTDIPFPNDSFDLVVMDPPHVQRKEPKGNITKRYGCLSGDWREMLRGGFAECFRVLKPGGTFIFKWSSVQFPLKDILELTPEKPLFGHQSGRRMNTHWVAFIKQNSHDQQT